MDKQSESRGPNRIYSYTDYDNQSSTFVLACRHLVRTKPQAPGEVPRNRQSKQYKYLCGGDKRHPKVVSLRNVPIQRD